MQIWCADATDSFTCLGENNFTVHYDFCKASGEEGLNRFNQRKTYENAKRVRQLIRGGIPKSCPHFREQDVALFRITASIYFVVLIVSNELNIGVSD